LTKEHILQKRYFVVTSHGWSGSHWLAVALDTHPEILCFHSALHLHARGDDSSEQFLKGNVRNHGVAVNDRESRSFDAAFDEVEKRATCPDKHVFGNVHTYRIRDLLGLEEKFGPPRPHMLMNLIRNPVSLVASGFGQLRSFMDWDIYTFLDVAAAVYENIGLATELANRHGLNLFDPSVQAFLAACNHLRYLARDQEIAPDAPTILMERVTSEPDYFAEVVRLLSVGELECTPPYLEEVFSLGQLNRHAQGEKLDARAQYERWEPWQQEAFHNLLTSSRLNDYYQKYGYDFSYIN
jgi:hypothetical protein